MPKIILVLIVLSVFIPGCHKPQTPTANPSGEAAMLQPQSLSTTITKHIESSYLLYLPPDYEAFDTPWPLVLFLHGIGERGSDPEHGQGPRPGPAHRTGPKLPCRHRLPPMPRR